jgi:hypothetical protein
LAESSDLLNPVNDLNMGIEGFDNMNGIVLGENEEDEAQ